MVVLAVHDDTEDTVRYTIRLPDGEEKRTVARHLRAWADDVDIRFEPAAPGLQGASRAVPD